MGGTWISLSKPGGYAQKIRVEGCTTTAMTLKAGNRELTDAKVLFSYLFCECHHAPDCGIKRLLIPPTAAPTSAPKEISTGREDTPKEQDAKDEAEKQNAKQNKSHEKSAKDGEVKYKSAKEDTKQEKGKDTERGRQNKNAKEAVSKEKTAERAKETDSNKEKGKSVAKEKVVKEENAAK